VAAPTGEATTLTNIAKSVTYTWPLGCVIPPSKPQNQGDVRRGDWRRMKQGGPMSSASRAETHVVTQSLYAAIYDEGSPANVKGFLERELQASKQDVSARGMDEVLTLFVFNERLMERAKRGELLAWTLTLDGVFRSVLDVGATPQDRKETPLVQSLGVTQLDGLLICPTGRLVLGCVGRLGESHAPAIVVQPGHYCVHFSRNEEQEGKHAMLKDLCEYPPGDGPDWTFAINPISQ
jgi:hypothetical protein